MQNFEMDVRIEPHTSEGQRHLPRSHVLHLYHYTAALQPHHPNMAQNAPKKSKPASSSSSKHPSQRKNTGTRVIKPKKPSLQKAQAMRKKHSAGLTALTERSLAGKAGHLEMLGGGKKEKKGQGTEGGQKDGKGQKGKG